MSEEPNKQCSEEVVLAPMIRYRDPEGEQTCACNFQGDSCLYFELCNPGTMFARCAFLGGPRLTQKPSGSHSFVPRTACPLKNLPTQSESVWNDQIADDTDLNIY
jgi:hypothetical protein